MTVYCVTWKYNLVLCEKCQFRVPTLHIVILVYAQQVIIYTGVKKRIVAQLKWGFATIEHNLYFKSNSIEEILIESIRFNLSPFKKVDIKALLWVKTTLGWLKILSKNSGNRTYDLRNASPALYWGRKFDSHCGWTEFSTSPVWFSLRIAL